jgi:hypothetical protein
LPQADPIHHTRMEGANDGFLTCTTSFHFGT